MNVTNRFDGAAEWTKLTPETQAEIGVTALELLAAWWAQECASDPEDGSDLLLRAADAADFLLVNRLRELMVDAVPHKALNDADGEPLLPSLLGPVCRNCGCSQHDACWPSCGWAETDLCTACHGKEAA